jgi:hypothetical protein
MPRERAVEAAGDGESGKASGCALAARIMTRSGMDLTGQCPSIKGSGEAGSPSEASVGSTHRPFRPGNASPSAAAFESDEATPL